MELTFNLLWVFNKSGSHEDRKKRVAKLEANPFNKFEKEVNYIKNSHGEDPPDWYKNDKNNINGLIETIKVEYPYLLNDTGDFLTSPDFSSRLGPEFRKLYYHIYKFSSMYTHPTPATKELYLKRKSDQNDSLKYFIDNEFSNVCGNAINLCCVGSSKCIEVFNMFDDFKERVDIRTSYIGKLESLREEASNNIKQKSFDE
jgi:hypothetical protein